VISVNIKQFDIKGALFGIGDGLIYEIFYSKNRSTNPLTTFIPAIKAPDKVRHKPSKS